MFLKNLVALAYAAGALAVTPYGIFRRDDICVAGGGGSGGGSGGGISIPNPITYVYIYVEVVPYPVFINSYITANTIININGGVTININNAPTYLQTTVIATSTITITSTVSATITNGVTVTPTPPPTPVIIAVNPVVLAKRHVKRESLAQGFVGPDGASTTNCTAASVFTIENGQLSSEGELVTTNTGTFAMPFAASPIIGNISTYFSIYNDVLYWNNSAFTNGSASFCNYNGTTEIVFIPTNLTSVCTPVNLITFPASDCVIGVMETSTSSSSSSSTTSSTSLSSSSSAIFTSTTVAVSTTAPSSVSSSVPATSSSISTAVSSTSLPTTLPSTITTSTSTSIGASTDSSTPTSSSTAAPTAASSSVASSSAASSSAASSSVASSSVASSSAASSSAASSSAASSSTGTP